LEKKKKRKMCEFRVPDSYLSIIYGGKGQEKEKGSGGTLEKKILGKKQANQFPPVTAVISRIRRRKGKGGELWERERKLRPI